MSNNIMFKSVQEEISVKNDKMNFDFWKRISHLSAASETKTAT
jgi:hypothetical protein